MKLANSLAFRFLLGSGVVLAALTWSMRTPQAQEPALYLDRSKPLEARVDDLLSRLTLEEKLALVHGDSKFTTAAIPRLGIPRRWLSDGPHGVREDVGPDTWKPAGRTDDFASSMPALIGLYSIFNGYLAEPDPDLVERAVRAASQADVAIIVGGLNHSKYFDAEASDRKDMKLPYGQDELIQRVVAANPRTIVVFLGGGPMEMGPWLAKVPAVMLAWYPGMEGGNALARVLFGDVNPSGKLPCTFPKRLEDSPAHALGAYPGKNGQEVYAEGILVGYRWFDTKKIEPLFPFGYGLSYTSFKYSSLKLTQGRDPKGPVAIAEFEIENAGTREGGEVAQLYVNQTQPRLPRPVKELKGFHKVFLKPGEKHKASIPLARSAFAYYDPARKGWLAEKGEFTVLIGGSSRDIHLESKFQLNETSIEK